MARLLLEHADELAQRVGARIELVGIAVRDLDAKRDVDLPARAAARPTPSRSSSAPTSSSSSWAASSRPARSCSPAIASGADVVTGNKALLATHGPELFAAAEQVGAQLYYEAAVGGAIPIIRPLRDSLAGDRIERILGIVNGTTNFILDRMDTTGASLEDALATATELGYAEADPTADIGGYDAAQKAAILASLAFHTSVPVDAVHREGITERHRRAGRRPPASAPATSSSSSRSASGSSTPRPATRASRPASTRRSCPASHPLAAVHGANNAVFVEAEPRPARSCSTARAPGECRPPPRCSATSSRSPAATSIGGPGTAESTHAELPVLDIGRVTTRYPITLEVADEPGVLEQIAARLRRARRLGRAARSRP